MSGDRTRRQNDMSGTGDVGQLLSNIGHTITGMFGSGVGGQGASDKLPPDVQRHKEIIDEAAEGNRPHMKPASEEFYTSNQSGGVEKFAKEMQDAVQPQRVHSHPLSRVDSAQDDDASRDPSRSSSTVSRNQSNLSRPQPSNDNTGAATATDNAGTTPTLTVADKVEASVENNPFTLPDPEDIGALMQRAVPAGAFTAQQRAGGSKGAASGGSGEASGEGDAARVAEKVEAAVEQSPFTLPDAEDIGAAMQGAVPGQAFKEASAPGADKPGVDVKDQATDPLGNALQSIGKKLHDTFLSGNTSPEQPPAGPPAGSPAGPPAAAHRHDVKEGDSVMDVVEKHLADSYKPPGAKTVPDDQESKDVSHNVERVDKLDDPVQKRIYDAETTKVAPGSAAKEDLSSPAEKEKEESSGVVLGVDRVDMTGAQPHDKPDTPTDPNSGGTDRFSAVTGIVGSGKAQAKEPTGKEVKDAQQEVVMHDPATGRAHIQCQDTNMGYSMDDPRHPRNVGRVSEGSSFVDKAAEKAELAAKGMYDDVTGGPRAGKDSAGIPGGQQHNFKTTAADVKETAKKLPEKVGEASTTAGQVASNLGDYAGKKMQGVKDTISTADTKSVEERVQSQIADVERRQKQLEGTEADPWGSGHEKQLQNLVMDTPPAEKKESFLDHLLHPFAKSGDVKHAQDISHNYKGYVGQKGSDPRVEHMRASAEADTAKLPAQVDQAEQADVNLSEGVRGDRTGSITDRAAKAGHEHSDPLDQEKKNLEERVAQKGYQMPHPAWRGQALGSEEQQESATGQKPQTARTLGEKLTPRVIGEKIKAGFSQLAELGKEALEARGQEGVPKTLDNEGGPAQLQQQASAVGSEVVGQVKETGGKMQNAHLTGGQQEQGPPAAGPDEGLMPGKEVDSTSQQQGASFVKAPLRAVGKALAHLADALEPHAKHTHPAPDDDTHHTSDVQQQRDTRPKATPANQGKGGTGGAQIMSREEHSTVNTVARTAGEAIGTVEGLRLAFADKLGHVRDQLAEHAPDIPDTLETSTEEILQQRAQQQQQQHQQQQQQQQRAETAGVDMKQQEGI